MLYFSTTSVDKLNSDPTPPIPSRIEGSFRDLVRGFFILGKRFVDVLPPMTVRPFVVDDFDFKSFKLLFPEFLPQSHISRFGTSSASIAAEKHVYSGAFLPIIHQESPDFTG